MICSTLHQQNNSEMLVSHLRMLLIFVNSKVCRWHGWQLERASSDTEAPWEFQWHTQPDVVCSFESGVELLWDEKLTIDTHTTCENPVLGFRNDSLVVMEIKQDVISEWTRYKLLWWTIFSAIFQVLHAIYPDDDLCSIQFGSWINQMWGYV